MSKNTIPDELIAVPGYDGYFWHPEEKVLYSLKIGGVLNALAKQRAVTLRYNYFPAGYNIRHKGRSKRLPFEFLTKLKPAPYEVPYAKSKLATK